MKTDVIHTPQETLMYLRQCLLPGDAQDGIDLEVPSWLVREAVEALATLEQRASKYEDALDRIVSWSKAYPLGIFPEPDFKKARELLEAGGMTLDAISASNMRHVVEGVAEIATAALSAWLLEEES